MEASSNEKSSLAVDSTQFAHRAVSPLVLRPALPGAWRTEEEDLPTIQSTRNQTAPPKQSSPIIPYDAYSLRHQSPRSSTEEDDPWAGFDSDITDGGGIMSPGGTAIPPVAPTLVAPSPAEPQFKFPAFSTERSQFNEDEDDLPSHAAMSMRAETILANAKKRLLVSRLMQSDREGTTDAILGDGRQSQSCPPTSPSQHHKVEKLYAAEP